MEIAAKEKVPAYIIFTDATLRDMCRKMPEDEAEFMGVSGVGRKKNELYGKVFLEAIRKYDEKAKSENLWTEKDDKKLKHSFDSGLSINEMSKEHGRSADDIRIRLKQLGLVN